MDPLSLLTRTDKWFLGGGRGAIYAPPFPKNLTAPGFWDECYLADVRLSRLFTLLLCDEAGRPIRLHSHVKNWRPDALTLLHSSEDIALCERRCVIGNAWVSELELLHGPDNLHVFLWSLQDVKQFGHALPWQSLVDCQVREDAIVWRQDVSWPESLEPDRTAVEQESLKEVGSPMLPSMGVWVALGASAAREGFTVNLAQRHDDSPLYETSVLPEKFRRNRLAGDMKLHVGTEPEGLLHMVQGYRLARGQKKTFAAGAGLSQEEAVRELQQGRAAEVFDSSEEGWRAFFGQVPQFSCSDPYLTNAYWYRWYGLRLNTVDMPSLPRLNKPFVTEGIGFFRNFITYSAQAHLREVSWMNSPELGVGILDNLVDCQREDGSFPGHNYTLRPSRDFYHADFATGLLQMHRLHPGSVGKEHTAMLRRYADYYLRHRTLSPDPSGPTLYDVFDQNETGQEYMSRYQFVSDAADKWDSFRVSGMDATVYAQTMFSVLDTFRAVDSTYRRFSEGALMGMARLAFDADASYFCDVNRVGHRSPARPATGFYPFLSPEISRLVEDLPDKGRGALDRWLLSPDEFWLPSGFPATALSDPTFSAEGEWKERRLNCPWNGRSWPMANSHLVDALANYARRVDASYRAVAGEAVLKAVRLLFHDSNPSRPCCYEHYNPLDGTPALYRGYDEYMHSWVVDLIMRHVVGVQPGVSELDPLVEGLDVECEWASPDR